MIRQCGGWLCGVSMVAAAVALPAAAFADSAAVQNKKPSIKLKANPAIGMPPFRVVVTAELTGGSNDFEDFYCASVEWDWGDGTTSEVKADCDPYEPGKSEIKRRYTQEHTYQSSGIGGRSQVLVERHLRHLRQPAGCADADPVRPEAKEQDRRRGADNHTSPPGPERWRCELIDVSTWHVSPEVRLA